MEHKLHLLESFAARGSDGRTYKVRAFEHLAREEALLSDGRELWEPTGTTEYRLDDGTLLRPQSDGSLRVDGSDVELQPARH
jgi:hypothetical protein